MGEPAFQLIRSGAEPARVERELPRRKDGDGDGGDGVSALLFALLDRAARRGRTHFLKVRADLVRAVDDIVGTEESRALACAADLLDVPGDDRSDDDLPDIGA